MVVLMQAQNITKANTYLSWQPSYAELKENVNIGSIWEYSKHSNVKVATI